MVSPALVWGFCCGSFFLLLVSSFSFFSLMCNNRIQNVGENFKENYVFLGVEFFLVVVCFFVVLFVYLVLNSFARQELHCTCFSTNSRG